MELVNIRELKKRASAAAEGYRLHVQVESVAAKTARNGKPFYELKFADAEDHVALRAWDDTPGFRIAENMRSGMFVELSGEWLDTEKFGIDARNWETRSLTEGEVEDLLQGGEALLKKQAGDYVFIEKACAELADPRLRGLCAAFLEQFGERFRRSGAAREYHHARRGGLVEHVAQMMRSAKAVASVYEELNEDLLVAGVLFHDVGKLWENCYAEKGFVMPFHEAGEMLGHISIGMELVNKLWHQLLESEESAGWKTLDPPSAAVRLHLLHLIASHHGQKDFGSPVVPATPEAMVLHYVDNLDAKLEMFARGYETSPPLAPSIFERVYPLPGKLVRPLPRVSGEEMAAPAEAAGEGATAENAENAEGKGVTNVDDVEEGVAGNQDGIQSGGF